jgi:hypothetical protein
MAMSKFIHEREDFKTLIEVVGGEHKIDPRLIEKDYWIMHALWGMNQLGFEYELKGGTSLSKGWKCIDRFSEDIDIYIHPPAELNLPNLIAVANGTSEQDRSPTSNFGLAKLIWIDRRDIRGLAPGGGFKTMTGTSQSAALYTHQLLKRVRQSLSK